MDYSLLVLVCKDSNVTAQKPAPGYALLLLLLCYMCQAIDSLSVSIVSIFKADYGGTYGQGADGKLNGELYFFGVIDLVRMNVVPSLSLLTVA